jgi:hypothetical protein
VSLSLCPKFYLREFSVHEALLYLSRLSQQIKQRVAKDRIESSEEQRPVVYRHTERIGKRGIAIVAGIILLQVGCETAQIEMKIIFPHITAVIAVLEPRRIVSPHIKRRAIDRLVKAVFFRDKKC